MPNIPWKHTIYSNRKNKTESHPQILFLHTELFKIHYLLYYNTITVK